MNAAPAAPAAFNAAALPDDQSRRWRELRKGLFFGLTVMDLDAALPVVSCTFPAICLSVVLDGIAIDDGGAVQAGFCPDELWVSATGEYLPTAMTIRPDRPVRVVELLETHLGRPAIRRLVDIQPGDVPATYADVAALASAVGFSPATPISDGIARFVAWYRSYHGI